MEKELTKKKNKFLLGVILLLGLQAPAQNILVDNFEDGNITNSIKGSWFSYDDRNNGGNSIATFQVDKSQGANGSTKSGHLHYSLGNKYQYFFSGMATNTGEITSSGKTKMDFSQIDSVVLYLKGNGKKLDIIFQSALATNSNNLCYKIAATPLQWKKIVIKLPSDLVCSFGSKCQNWSEVNKEITAIQFKATSRINGEVGDVWVDDISIYGTTSTVRPPAKAPIAFGEFFNENFDAEPLGTYTSAQLDKAWNNPLFNNGVDEGRVKIVSSPSYSGKSLQILYPKGKVGSQGSGAQWPLVFPGGGAYDSLYFEYKIMFPIGTDFAKGGKLPGFAGGTTPSGGQTIDGTDGFSARLMWRKNSSGADANNAYLVNYMYYMDMPSTFGEDLWYSNPYTSGVFSKWIPEGKVFLQPGKWHTIKNLVVINTPGKPDGKVVAWVDGVKVLENKGLRFRAEGVHTFKVDQFFFSSFYGGSTSEWAPANDSYAYFDEFRISTKDFSVVTNTFEKSTENISLNIFPNPISDQSEIVIESISNEELTCEILDLSGKRLTTLFLGNPINGKVNLSLMNNSVMTVMNAGTYIILVRQGNNVNHKKLVKI